MQFRARESAVRLWLGIATAFAAVATAGSLWFSLGLGLVPCDLCWYQRILMYPLVVVLGIATIEERVGVWKTALVLSVPGGVIAAYHSVLQITAESCSFGRACGAVLWEAPVVGLTIPNLSLLGFLLVTLSVFAAVETARLRE